ncbi:MAG: DUF262 domain-containing protein [FCB group bacterium]|nr:DUF262 domain-containing protein [FCB group bacterium]
MGLKSVDKIFTKRILRIPAYQRGYSWSNNTKISSSSKTSKNVTGQLMDLWNDLINARGSWHYTGLITLARVHENEYPWLPNHEQFAIVDGQQRITSILILISVLNEQSKALEIVLGDREGDVEYQYLYHNSKEGLKAYIFGYDRDNPSDKYFRKHILGMDGVEDDSSESVYTENLLNAKLFFQAKVKQYIGKNSSKLRDLYTIVTSNLRFNEYILPSDLSEFVVFETMNNRGKPLSELEKLKNRLMYLSDKMTMIKKPESSKAPEIKALKNQLYKSINTAWITIYKALGSEKIFPLPDEEFIKAHWIVYFEGYNRAEANVYGNYLFNEYFTIEKIISMELSADNIETYVKSLQESAILWSKLNFTKKFQTGEEPWQSALRGLHRVGFRNPFKPLVLALLHRKENLELLSVVKLLEEYAFKLFHISDRQSNTGNSKLFTLAHTVYSQNQVGEQKIAEYAKYQIREHIGWYYTFSAFFNQIQQLFEAEKKEGYYGWSGVIYFLYEYDLELRSANKTTTKRTQLAWSDFNNKKSIEHIFPQSAALSLEEFCDGDESEKRVEEFEKIQRNWNAFADYTSAERKRFCGSLGNLLAISISDNASFGNDPFVYKVDQSKKGAEYINRGYLHDSMSAQIVAKEPDWTPITLLARGVRMIDSMLAMLGEDKHSIEYERKVDLLGLKFMLESDVKTREE